MSAWCSIIAPLAALAVNVLTQILAVRLQQGRHFLRAVVLGFVAGAILLIAVQYFFPPSKVPREAWIITMLVNLPLYAALSYCFFNFANLGQSSIRIRIYAEIAERADGVSIGRISDEYNEAALMEVRLQRLEESGDIVKRNDRYFIGRTRLVPIASIIFALKKFVLGRTSEFE